MTCHIPTKITTKRNQTPWINIRIKRLHRRIQAAFNIHKIHRNHATHEQFCTARKIAHTVTRMAHIQYIGTLCSDAAKRFWSCIKSLKVDTIGIPTLTKDHHTESDNNVNDQFKSDFTKEHTNWPKNHTQPCQLCLTLPSQQRE